MRIVHMSDVHCGPQFREDALHTALDEINDLSPDAVVVSGDLTENGLPREFEWASRELRSLKAEQVIYISGNHDYRSTGYLLFRQYFPFRQVTEVDDAVIIVLSSARPDRDDGEVGNRQNLWLEEQLAKYQEKTKIVAVHHHVIPVPDTGADQITIIDAGDVLRSLVKSKVDLVLCGHRHRPWRWLVEKMQIVHAGSVSCEKLRGCFFNSYNIIDVKGGRISSKLKIVGGDNVDFKEIVSRREILKPSDLAAPEVEPELPP